MKYGRIIWSDWHVSQLDGKERSNVHFAGIVRLPGRHDNHHNQPPFHGSS
jgi:hypothetical protein